MKKNLITSINLVSIVTIPLILWLGFTNRVDWWVILLIVLLNIKIEIGM